MTYNSWTRSVVVCLLASVLVAQVGEGGQAVEFQVVSRFGKSLEFTLASLKSRSGEEHVKNCRLGICKNLPAGIYEYRVVAKPEGQSITGSALVGYPTSLITVLADGEGEGVSLSGVVHGLSRYSRGHAWIRFQLAFGSYVRDVSLRPDGTFTVHGVIGGQYVILVVANGQIVAHRIFMCCFNGVAEKPIELLAGPPEGLPR